MELHETTKKLQNASTAVTHKPTEDFAPQKKQIEEQRKQVEEFRRQTEEQKRALDNRQRQIEQKEKELQDLEKKLQKRKEQVDQLEMSLQKVNLNTFKAKMSLKCIFVCQAGGNAAALGDLNKKLVEAEKNFEKSQEEVKRSGAEMERLLQLVQMSQEEQNAKEKQIMELQQ